MDILKRKGMVILKKQTKGKYKVEKGHGFDGSQSGSGQVWGLTSTKYIAADGNSNKDMGNPCEDLLNGWYILESTIWDKCGRNGVCRRKPDDSSPSPLVGVS